MVTLLVGDLAMSMDIAVLVGEGDLGGCGPMSLVEASLSASEASVAPASAESSLGRFRCCWSSMRVASSREELRFLEFETSGMIKQDASGRSLKKESLA